MGTTTCLVLRKRVAQACNDFIEVAVTTAINNDNDVVSTNLNAYDLGMDEHFDGWWCYITDKANIGVFRMVSSATSYDTDLGVITVLGAALADDSTNEATIRLSRYDPALYLNAINDAIRETYPNVLRYIDDLSLITGNILPPFNWSSSTALDYYTENTGGVTKTTDTTYTRNGPTSAKATASGANDDLVLDSDDYPRLLDIQGKTVSAYVWVYPQTANDAYIEIYTLQPDGTAQTLTSTTTCPATKRTLLKLESQAINSGLTKCEVRLRTKTDGQYVYFDPPRLMGRNPYEYLLPSDLQDGTVRDVLIQTSGYSDDICDDLHPRSFAPVYGWDIIPDGTDQFLSLRPNLYSNSRRIRLIGDAPLEVISGAANVIDAKTISLSEEQPLSLLIKYAEYKLFEAVSASPASEDISRYERATQKALGEYYRLLPSARMMRTGTRLNIRRY